MVFEEHAAPFLIGGEFLVAGEVGGWDFDVGDFHEAAVDLLVVVALCGGVHDVEEDGGVRDDLHGGFDGGLEVVAPLDGGDAAVLATGENDVGGVGVQGVVGV